jgi:hypothetical protein
MAQDWDGPPTPDGKGYMPVDDFNDFLKDHPNLRRSPVRAGIKFVDLEDPNALTTRVNAKANRLENPTDVRVTVVEDGLADDSVRTVRYTLEFEQAGNRWRLESARRTQRCQPGRGNQNFSPKPCQ